ncbi:DUF6602 domain-containing protein [Mycobacterium kansasii]|uniref:DUF6602 domain-containing protein n=2 Tax=Mycobacterium kansasii TaxID=1768 RepID=UPI0009E4477F|nr:DUF6602 domain-containing protein [Mycobacterium kansasii]UCA21267.1 hypothetical protein LA359_08160 [Mycobacterium kansasii]UGT81318.1 hypothetical protein LTS70_00265 [Mycobacterium kansasii]UGT85593.1 hypothetical protein LTT71_21920 [Mycobacterium kansasii]UGU26169.1 hypothetical protein LT351_05580 [Mycobacterium kansasii]
MNAISDFWATGAAQLRANFERTRQTQRDSHIKGGANERALADFLKENLGAHRVAVSSSIIDPEGRQSDEVDVAVVNEFQPLWTGDSQSMLIAHAVEAAYQVKARLSTEELRRAMKNARSVKQLYRRPGKGGEVFAAPTDVPRFVERIPFFIFAYTTNISGEAAIKLIRDEFKDSPWHEQADGIFVLDGWAAVNIGNNDGAQRVSPLERRGFVLADELPSLVQMLWTHCRLRPPRWCTSRAVS